MSALHKAALRLCYITGRLDRASTQAEEDALCDERDKLLALFREVDAALADIAPFVEESHIKEQQT